MKYKNIYAAIHNRGHSFLSFMNYVDDGYVVDDLVAIHSKKHDITVDWIALTLEPELEMTDRVRKSLRYYAGSLSDQFTSLNVELGKLTSLKLRWPVGGRKFMEATDDRGKYYKIYCVETK